MPDGPFGPPNTFTCLHTRHPHTYHQHPWKSSAPWAGLLHIEAGGETARTTEALEDDVWLAMMNGSRSGVRTWPAAEPDEPNSAHRGAAPHSLSSPTLSPPARPRSVASSPTQSRPTRLISDSRCSHSSTSMLAHLYVVSCPA